MYVRDCIDIIKCALALTIQYVIAWVTSVTLLSYVRYSELFKIF